jgi:ABC-2 type transport system permease protein
MESLEGFQLIITFVVFSLYFLSGALFPSTNLQTCLSILTTMDPPTYTVDALRNLILGITGKNSLTHEIMILLASVIIMGTLGMLSFKRIKAV